MEVGKSSALPIEMTFGLKPLLTRLNEEVLRVGRNHDARHDLRATLLERGDLRREVLRH